MLGNNKVLISNSYFAFIIVTKSWCLRHIITFNIHDKPMSEVLLLYVNSQMRKFKLQEVN
jgi:hypothetical protein